jgi:uncharacterized membrane protein
VEGEEVVVAATVMGEGEKAKEVVMVEVEMEVVVVMGEGVREVAVEKEVVEVVVMVEGEKDLKKLKVVLQVDKQHPYKNNSHYMHLHNIHNCWGHLKGLYKFHCNMLALNWCMICCHMEFVIRFLIEDL